MASLGSENHEHKQQLVSWKEIASYLNRAERTVKRWERDRGLPVHRVPGGERGGVYAYPAELAEWLRGKSSDVVDEDDALPSPPAKNDEPDPASRPVVTAEIAAAPRVVHRRPLTFARFAAWLGPLALTAALIFYFSGGYTDSHVTAVGDRKISNPVSADLEPDSVAVLPFTNAGRDANSDYLSDGVTESLIGNLVLMPQLRVRSRDAVFRLKGKDIDVKEAGTELAVSKVVSGRVAVDGNKIEISAELIDVRQNTEIWGKKYPGKMSQIILLQKQMAGDIAQELRSTLSAAAIQQLTRQGTQNVEAYDLYLKGRYAWNVRDRAKLEAAISYFNQAIEKDPSYALAYSGLADVYSVLPNFYGNPNEDFPKSNAAARKALELDPTLAHPHAVLGDNEMEYDWDFASGEAEFKKALALDPDDATAHQWYAERISALGRHKEAYAEINRAHQLDPLSPVITRVIGATLVDAGEYDQAIAVCKQLVMENPTFPIAHDCLVYAYWGKHMYPQVVEEWKNEGEITGDPNDVQFVEAMEHGFRSAGWKGALAGAITVSEARRAKGYASPFFIGRLYADMGDRDKAFEWLSIAYREHDRLLVSLNVSPGFENIRFDPRFSELERKVGLPKLQ